MRATEALRALWTGGTGVGTLVMLYLLREVSIDAWAVEQVRRPGFDVLKVVTAGEVADQEIRLVAIFSLFVAGALSYLVPVQKPRKTPRPWAAPTVTGLLCMSAAAQVWLGIVKLQRRRSLLLSLQLNRKAH